VQGFGETNHVVVGLAENRFAPSKNVVHFKRGHSVRAKQQAVQEFHPN
jgi:hypothetical protein